MLITDAFNGLRPHSAQIFSSMVFSNSSGMYWYSTIVAYWLNIPFAVLAHAIIVEKARKCLDFTVTIVIIHTVVIWLAYEWPSQLGYWLNQVLWVTVTCLLSESLCMKLETQEIKLSINDLIDKSAEQAKDLFSKIKTQTKNTGQKRNKKISS